MKKTELLLVKTSQVESVLAELFARPHKAQATLKQNAGDMWDEFIAQFEALTAMTVEGDTAIIPLRGMVTPDDPFAMFYGETNLTMFNKNLDKALQNPKIKQIALNIYSPGGYVYGVEAAANKVYQGRQQKPIIAYTDSLAASAAYWIASAASKVVLGSETAEVGSIGVYLVHFDYSEMLKEEGIKVTEITSGEFKGIGSPYAAMTPEERKMLEADSNYVYTRFVNTVARNRGMDVKDILKSANGLTFYGSEAIKLGLADSINTLQEVLAMSTAANNQPAANGGTQQPAAEANADRARAEKAEAELAAYKAKEAAEAAARAATECQVAFKESLGREATAEEVAAYQASDENGRKVIRATLKESKANRDKLIEKAGLTEEQVKGENNAVKASLQENGLVQAAIRLGYTDQQ